ncbi:MAG: hypothetical protein GPJ54_04180 [Candidatus Heimdallarchaeota archaeon]|nr:hypothetical protein [Candidatus Heimdallarchaeota archaeon]
MDYYDLSLPPDLMGVLDGLLERIEYTQKELMDFGLFLYHPDIFLEAPIEYVKLTIYLDESEQGWLKEICEFYQKPEKEMILDLLLDNDLPLYS